VSASRGLTAVPGHARADHRRSLLDRPILTAALFAALGVVIAGAILIAGGSRSARQPPPVPDAAAAFLAAWRAHLLASWSVDEIQQRTTAAGATVRFQIHVAQRPPDSVEVAGGTVDARRGSTLIACATPPGGDHPVCRLSPTTRTWDQEVDVQIAGLRTVLQGPRAVYRVVGAGRDCFRFDLTTPAATLPVTFGRGASYCLDPRTGAVRSSTVRVVGAVDAIATVRAHAPATAADLALPATATYER
jgi:hypothetical protein